MLRRHIHKIVWSVALLNNNKVNWYNSLLVSFGISASHCDKLILCLHYRTGVRSGLLSLFDSAFGRASPHSAYRLVPHKKGTLYELSSLASRVETDEVVAKESVRPYRKSNKVPPSKAHNAIH